MNFDNILENIDKIFKQKIEKDKQDVILNYFDKNINSHNLIQKKILNTVSRKYISRYIIYKNEEYELNKNTNLLDILSSKNDLWDSSIINDKNFVNEMNKLKSEFNLEIIHIVEFYNLLTDRNNSLKENKETDKNEEKKGNKRRRKRFREQ